MKKHSDLSLLLWPVQWLFSIVFRFLHWWLLTLFVAYLFSGFTIVEPDEIALIYRFGALVDQGTAQAVHEPGLLMAFPKPIDRVQRIPIQKIMQQEIKGLHFTANQKEGQPLSFLSSSGIDPEKIGYALTGDGNVVHISMLLNYQIVDPVQYILMWEEKEPVLQNIVQAATIREMGGIDIDSVLSDGREKLLKAISKRAQSEIERWNVGVQIVSLEAKDLVPPYQVKDDFTAVQSADIEKQTALQKAKEYQTEQIPKAESERNKALQAAKAYARTLRAKANSEASVFNQLFLEAQQNPDVVWTRLHREGLEQILEDAGSLRFIPPPLGRRYNEGFRLTVQAKETK